MTGIYFIMTGCFYVKIWCPNKVKRIDSNLVYFLIDIAVYLEANVVFYVEEGVELRAFLKHKDFRSREKGMCKLTAT